MCPGKNLVLLAQRGVWLQAPAWLTAGHPLPGTLRSYGLRFKLDGCVFARSD